MIKGLEFLILDKELEYVFQILISYIYLFGSNLIMRSSTFEGERSSSPRHSFPLLKDDGFTKTVKKCQSHSFPQVLVLFCLYVNGSFWYVDTLLTFYGLFIKNGY